MNRDIELIDYIVIVLYIGGIFLLAYHSGRLSNKHRSNDLEANQYLAGKSLSFTESLFSILATEVSALTFLGIPAFVFDLNFSFVQIYMGAFVSRFVIAKYFLPQIYNQGLTVYETIAKENSTPQGRSATAGFYFINKLLSIGVRLFSGSIMIAAFFNISIFQAIFSIAVITYFYTLIGGLKAVVRTDLFQITLFISGGVIAHFYIPHINGESWSHLMQIASDAGKTNFFDPLNPWALLTGAIGGILFDMGTHGVDQDFVQRLTGSRDLKSAQRAIFFSAFLSISVGTLFLGVGALLWAHYQSFPKPDIPSDQLFAHFISNYFPTGLKGLMVSAVLAATMSTLDSTINALSACFYNDIAYKRKNKLTKLKSYYFRDSLLITLLLLIIALFATKSTGLLLLGMKIASWSGGTMLAIFFAKVLWKKWLDPKLDFFAVFGAYILGFISVYICSYIFNFAWQWNVYFAFVVSIIYLWIYKKIRA